MLFHFIVIINLILLNSIISESIKCDYGDHAQAAITEKSCPLVSKSGQDEQSASQCQQISEDQKNFVNTSDEVTSLLHDRPFSMNDLKFVQIIHSKEDLNQFLDHGTLQIVIFFYLTAEFDQKKPASENLLKFLEIYNKAAEHLQPHNISFGLVNCDGLSSSSYCASEKVGNFAYGFQKHQEKIGFPIETLHDEDAIVASSLHLSLLHSVPIIQSLIERRELEDKCRFKKDIILAFHKSLGTKEHGLFLEISEEFKDRFTFALTTYSSAVHGLPNSPLLRDTISVDPVIYILHCSKDPEKLTQDFDPCSVISHFHDRFNRNDFSRFLNIFRLPLIMNVSDQKSGGLDSILSTYAEYDLPYLIFVYDDTSRKRVFQLASTIAKMFRGSIFTLTIYIDNALESFPKSFHMTEGDLRTPALLFYVNNNQNEFLRIFNDIDRPLEWIYDHLDTYRKGRQEPLADEEEYVTHPYYELDELKQDDEVQMEMVDDSSFTEIAFVNGQKDLNSILSRNPRGTAVFVFYVTWDPASNLLLQHLQLASNILRSSNSSASLHRINCFEYPQLCEAHEVRTYPVLKMFDPEGFEITYDGLIEAQHLIASILLLECPEFPMRLSSAKLLEDIFDNLAKVCPAMKFAKSITIGILSKSSEIEEFSMMVKPLFGYKAVAIVIDESLAKTLCFASRVCLLILKSDDKYQPRKVFYSMMDDHQMLRERIKFIAEPVFGHLHPENLSVMEFDSECGDEDPNVKKIIFILMLPTYINELPSCPSIASTRKNDITNERYPEKKDDDKHPVHEHQNEKLFNLIGEAAANFSVPGVVFSHIFNSENLAIELLDIYQLAKENPHLVAVDRVRNVAIIYDGDLRKSSNGSSMFLHWITTVINGTAQSTVDLPSKEWLPTMESFNYLDFLEEDFLRDADEQLAFDMEIDVEKDAMMSDEVKIRRYN